MPIFPNGPPKSGNEEKIRQPIGQHLVEILGHNEVEFEYTVGTGRCDIVVPKAQLVIETKAPGVKCGPKELASGQRKDGEKETQIQQLNRYVACFQEMEWEAFLSDPKATRADSKWVGVLTNGKVWHAWNWPPRQNKDSPVPIPEVQDVAYSDDIDEFLLNTATRIDGKPFIPFDPSEAFSQLKSELDKLFLALGDIPAFATQCNIWEELIRGSGIPVAEERRQDLYREHVFLLAVARAVSGLFEKGQRAPEDLLENSYGSWLGEMPKGRKWLASLVRKVQSYNWLARPVDVLRNLYEGLIPKADRKLYGEYYTPDWLAGMVVEEMLDDDWLKNSIQKVWDRSGPVEGVGVLDPACGSGTFLYHAAKRIMKAVSEYLEVSRMDQPKIASWLVFGIDIHPVAVEMARATLLRALGPGSGIEPAVYQGDALLVNREWRKKQEQMSLIDERDTIFQYPPGSNNMFSIPYSILDQGNMAERLQRLVDSAKSGNARPPASVTAGLEESDTQTLLDAHKTLSKIIKVHRDGVWTWYIRNQLAPANIRRRKVNRIVSNPPWLRYNEIQEPNRKREVKGMAKEHKLWVGGKNATGFDLAGLFVVETKRLYLGPKGCGAFVLNAAALRAKNWSGFRDAKHHAGALDLSEKYADGHRLAEKPFSGAYSCVVGLTNEDAERLVLVDLENRVRKSMSWAEVKEKVYRPKAIPPPPI